MDDFFYLALSDSLRYSEAASQINLNIQLCPVSPLFGLDFRLLPLSLASALGSVQEQCEALSRDQFCNVNCVNCLWCPKFWHN